MGSVGDEGLLCCGRVGQPATTLYFQMLVITCMCAWSGGNSISRSCPSVACPKHHACIFGNTLAIISACAVVSYCACPKLTNSSAP
jgi:hypothetical protein